MKRKKKYKFPSRELVEVLINKELEKYNITMDDILSLPEEQLVEGIPWYNYYTFDSKEEFNTWKEFCIDVLSRQVTPKLSKERINEQFSMLNLGWGLKINYEDN